MCFTAIASLVSCAKTYLSRNLYATNAYFELQVLSLSSQSSETEFEPRTTLWLTALVQNNYTKHALVRMHMYIKVHKD